MSEKDEEKKKSKFRGWVGVGAGAEGIGGSVDDKIKAAAKKEKKK